MRIILVRTRGLFRPAPELDYAAGALREALTLQDHSVDLVAIPFRWGASKLSSLRSFDLSRTPMDETVDRLVSLDLAASVLEHDSHLSLLLDDSGSRESVSPRETSEVVRRLLARPARTLVASSFPLRTLRACVPDVDCAVVVPGLASTDLAVPWSSPRATSTVQIEDPECLEGTRWRTDLLLSACARSRSRLDFRWVVETGEAEERVRERVQVFRLDGRVRVEVRSGCYRLPGAHPLGLVDLRPQRGLAFPALAALRSGTPILTSRLSGATAEVVEKARWGRVIPETAQELAEAIGRLADQPAEVGVNGLARYRSITSDWAEMASYLIAGSVGFLGANDQLGVA